MTTQTIEGILVETLAEGWSLAAFPSRSVVEVYEVSEGEDPTKLTVLSDVTLPVESIAALLKKPKHMIHTLPAASKRLRRFLTRRG